ncbi:MAG: hypothetical protein HKO53_11720 [Gemmatimonadetes bacterium]|nr:hypothetical protein [Gemmatimonadota bacterium]
MAKQIKCEIDGNKVPNVLDVEYGLDVAKDTNGAPTDARPRNRRIMLRFRSSENSDLWSWALHPKEEYFKAGKVEFMDPKKENKVLKTLEWTGGFVENYIECQPHIHRKKNDPQYEVIEVSAASITINGVEWKGQGIWI